MEETMAEGKNSYGISRYQICAAVHYLAARMLGWLPKEAACLALLRTKLGPIDKLCGESTMPPDGEPEATLMFGGIEVALTLDANGLVDAASASDTACTAQQFHTEVEAAFGALWLPVLAQCHAMLEDEEGAATAYVEALDAWQEQDFLAALAAEPCDFIDYDDGEDEEEDEDIEGEEIDTEDEDEESESAAA
jgi:hypothetical protein